jgi:hypothetical protein
LETLLVLWKKNFFTKRCAFQSSTRICKTYFRHSKNETITEAKKWKTMQKMTKFARFDKSRFFGHHLKIRRLCSKVVKIWVLTQLFMLF